MNRRSLSLFLAAALVVALVVVACGSTTSPATSVAETGPTATSPPPEKPAAAGRCGDGVCDEMEQGDPDLCPQDCADTVPPTEPPLAGLPPTTPTPLPAVPTEAPEAPPTGAPPSGACGDGVCDEMEQKDPQLCPQDCAGVEGPGVGPEPTVPATGSPDYEPPINVFLVLHIDPSMDLGGATFTPDAGLYQRSRDEIDWLMEEAERHSMHFTALYNGWFAKWAVEQGDMAQFRALVDAGHEIGSHAHRLIYDPAQDLWVSYHEQTDRYGRPNYDAEISRQCWQDADQYMDQVVAQIGAPEQNTTMCAVPFKASDEGQMMHDFGFIIAAGNRSEKGTSYFGHQAWNPWRPSTSDEPGHELGEDLGAGYISIDHLAQIGRSESHGLDNSVPQLQRRFLMLYAEWLARERTGAEDRVWTFGFCLHPNYGAQHNADLTEFLTWLDEHFVGQESPHGNIVAHYATIDEIGDEYLDWEAAHPGTSSFRWVRDDPYPYSYSQVPAMLADAAYEAHVDLGPGVSCFRFSKDGSPVYMLWSDRGERAVDLSSQLSGQVRLTDIAGVETIAEAGSVPLTEEPLFAEPVP